MKKPFAIVCTIVLHFMFVAGLATTTTAAVEIATVRASHVSFVG